MGGGVEAASGGVPPFAVYAAVIALFGGVVVAALTKVLEWRRENRRRDERVRDIVAALFTEIALGTDVTAEQTDAAAARRLIRAEQPFGPSDRTDFVFESVKSDLTILPQAVIFDVVRYYKAAERCNRMVDLVLHDAYRKDLDPDGRRRFAEDILVTARAQQMAGGAALATLARYMEANDGNAAGSKQFTKKLHSSRRRQYGAALTVMTIARMLARR